MQSYSKHLYNGDVREANICSVSYSFKLSKEEKCTSEMKSRDGNETRKGARNARIKKNLAYSLCTVHWAQRDLCWSGASSLNRLQSRRTGTCRRGGAVCLLNLLQFKKFHFIWKNQIYSSLSNLVQLNVLFMAVTLIQSDWIYFTLCSCAIEG